MLCCSDSNAGALFLLPKGTCDQGFQCVSECPDIHRVLHACSYFTCLFSIPHFSLHFICVFRVWIHGLGYPIALVLSTLLVRLLRIFNCYGKLSKYTSGIIAMAVYALLITSPNGLICLVWSTSDHYLSEVIFPVRGGYVFVTEQCRSNHTIQWLLGLLIYLVVISLLLVVAGILTRNVKHKNTKKVSALSFVVVFTLSLILSYWYILRIIGANVVLVHAVLLIA